MSHTVVHHNTGASVMAVGDYVSFPAHHGPVARFFAWLLGRKLPSKTFYQITAVSGDLARIEER